MMIVPPSHNPRYAPRCFGPSCGAIQIVQGTEGAYFLTRGGSELLYTNNERAWIYFPFNGEISILRMDVEVEADKLVAYWRNGEQSDLGLLNVGDSVRGA